MIKAVNINKSGKRVPLGNQLRGIILDELISKFGNVCWYCGIRLQPKRIHIDHIDPLSKGGQDTIFNLALACATCNRAKWDLTLEEFYGWIKRLRWMENYPARPGFGERTGFYDRGDEPELDKKEA